MRVPALLTRVVFVPAVMAALVLSILAATPAQAQKIRPDYWGMHANNWHAPYTPSVRFGAANFTTTGTYWRALETSPGEFEFARLDQQVAAAEARGAQPMIVLGQTPQFHSSRPDASDYYTYAPSMTAWKRYVSKVASRYGSRLDYQIWPEPNIIQNWKASPRKLAQLTAAASKAITRHARKARVVGPAMTLRLKSQRSWMVKYYKQSIGGKRVHRYLDAIAIDTFPHLTGTPENSYALIRKAKKQLARAGVKKVPYWNNEINYGVEGGHETTPHSLTISKQQAYVVRTYALSAAAKMSRTYWLGWFSNDTMAINMAAPDMDSTTNDALPPAKAYSTVRGWMNGSEFVGCKRNRSGLWTCTMKTRKQVRKIYWHPNRTKRVNAPRGTVRVENQTGAFLGRKGRYRVGYRPIMVATKR